MARINGDPGMDFDRLIKRLLITLAVSLFIVLLAKVFLGKMYGDMDQAIANKKLRDAATKPAAAQPPAPQPNSEAASAPVQAIPESGRSVPETSEPTEAKEPAEVQQPPVSEVSG